MKLLVLLLSVLASFAAACSTAQIPAALQKQYKGMFVKLDTDKNGYIDPTDVHLPKLSGGIMSYMCTLGVFCKETQALSQQLEKKVLDKFKGKGEHQVSECEFANSMFQATTSGSLWASKVPDFKDKDKKPVVVHG